MVGVAGRGGKRVAREEISGRRRRRRRRVAVVLIELGVVMVVVVEVGVGMGVVEGVKRVVVGEESGGGLGVRVEGEGVRRRIHCRRPAESERRWREDGGGQSLLLFTWWSRKAPLLLHKHGKDIFINWISPGM